MHFIHVSLNLCCFFIFSETSSLTTYFFRGVLFNFYMLDSSSIAFFSLITYSVTLWSEGISGMVCLGAPIVVYRDKMHSVFHFIGNAGIAHDMCTTSSVL